MAKGIKKGSKKAKKEAKRLNKHIFGKKGPMITHSFESVTSFYKNGKEKNPIYSFTNSGEYKISLVKFILILLCVIAGLAVIAVAIKSLVQKYLPSKCEADDELDYLWEDEEDLPF